MPGIGPLRLSETRARARSPRQGALPTRPAGPSLRRPSLDTPSIVGPMLESLLKSVFGSKHERDVRRVRPIVDEINRIFESYRDLSDEQLRGKTEEFRARIAQALE